MNGSSSAVKHDLFSILACLYLVEGFFIPRFKGGAFALSSTQALLQTSACRDEVCTDTAAAAITTSLPMQLSARYLEHFAVENNHPLLDPPCPCSIIWRWKDSSTTWNVYLGLLTAHVQTRPEPLQLFFKRNIPTSSVVCDI
jgi:hypothetical protein